jgi:hypothetical protein
MPKLIADVFSRRERFQCINARFPQNLKRVVLRKNDDPFSSGQSADVVFSINRECFPSGGSDFEGYKRVGKFQPAYFFNHSSHDASNLGFGSSDRNNMDARNEVEQSVVIQDENAFIVSRHNSMFAGWNIELAPVAGSDFESNKWQRC